MDEKSAKMSREILSEELPSKKKKEIRQYEAHVVLFMIESAGEGVTNLKEGDIVMPLYLGECGECLNCKSGKTNLCHKYPLNFTGLMPDGTSRMHIGDQKIYHHFSCGTWSEYIAIDAGFAFKVDPRVSLPHASFLCCGFTRGYGSAWREITTEKGSTVAVIGVGAVGLGASTCTCSWHVSYTRQAWTVLGKKKRLKYCSLHCVVLSPTVYRNALALVLVVHISISSDSSTIYSWHVSYTAQDWFLSIALCTAVR
ncbi:alcohol dehydrogenase [Forsythia ovata]|uniref:Alcohol dehydrogenase n=1 Tax=Forsythia ovata TaxID=205694 RepID=A0ABD1W573_9LAMI